VTTCDLDPRLGLGANPFPLPLHFEVCAVGEAVRTVRPGYRVAVPFQISCANSRHAQPLDRHTAIYGAADLDVRVCAAGGAWGDPFSERIASWFSDSSAQVPAIQRGRWATSWPESHARNLQLRGQPCNCFRGMRGCHRIIGVMVDLSNLARRVWRLSLWFRRSRLCS
jgi:hypothetical protein